MDAAAGYLRFPAQTSANRDRYGVYSVQFQDRELVTFFWAILPAQAWVLHHTCFCLWDATLHIPYIQESLSFHFLCHSPKKDSVRHSLHGIVHIRGAKEMKNNFKKTIASCVQASISHYAGRSSSFNPDPLGWPGAMSVRWLSRADLRIINTCSKSSSVSNFARFFKRLLRLSAFRISVANFLRSCLAACCSVLSFCRYSVSVSLSKTSSTFCTMLDACALALALDFGLCFAAGFGGVPPAQGAAAESPEGWGGQGARL